MNHGFSTLDLAREMSDVRRSELTDALRTRPGPHAGIRDLLGQTLVNAGLRLLGTPLDRRSAVGASGC